MKEIFVAIDGDNVGSRLEYYMLTNQLIDLKKFSLSFNDAIQWLQEALIVQFRAEIIFMGGDNLLAVLNHNIPNIKGRLEEIREEFFSHTGCTLSIGVGENTKDAYLGLKLAKVSGKNQICQLSEGNYG